MEGASVRGAMQQLLGQRVAGRLQGGGGFAGRLIALDAAMNLLLGEARLGGEAAVARACLLRGNHVLLFGREPVARV